MTPYVPLPRRYDAISYTRCGRSGLRLPRLSLGLWHNFGESDPIDQQRTLVRRAFDLGITHFDLANNYGPPQGAAEENFGRILRKDFAAHRNELIISTKAGYTMWPGPYGDWGSRKYLLSSLDQSLQRMGISYVDIFYHHRPDPATPLEETMTALGDAVRSGRALYAGISNYKADQTREAAAILKSLGVPLLIHQPSYNMFNRWVEPELLPALADLGTGCIAFSPLAQGLLTNRYLQGIPADSRALKAGSFLKAERITPALLAKVQALNEVATARCSSLAQLAVLWVLRNPEITTVLVGASKTAQIDDLHAGLQQPPLGADELKKIETILAQPG
ncbi:MAG: L-glyceraldehyde 3-phosphate reductase [Verrucomicrobiota bacterium]|jgi:L-glyceraldehyde 3-phosphate reductase